MKAEEIGRKLILARLVLAIISTLAVEAALYTVWRWTLPEFGIKIPLAVLIAVMVAWAIFAVANFWLVTHVLQKQALIGLPAMIGSQGKVVSPLVPEGQVMIKGELWEARSIDNHISSGGVVMVVGQDGLKLIVRRAGSSD